MSLPEATPPTPPTPATGGKPSLMGGASAPAGEGGDPPRQSLRMLDALESKKASPQRALSPKRAGWVVALALAVVAVVGYQWWDRAADGGGSPALIDAVRQARMGQATSLPGAAVAAAPAPTAAAASVTASASASSAPVAADAVAVDATSGPANIERSADAQPFPAPALMPPFASAPAAMPAPEKRATLASARPAPPRVVAAAPRPAAARPASPRVNEAPAASGDPDVTLLSAMLARLSGDTPAATPRATIAQLVERCEAQSAKDSIEAFECKRRICAGYWGKADACPTALAPKKN